MGYASRARREGRGPASRIGRVTGRLGRTREGAHGLPHRPPPCDHAPFPAARHSSLSAKRPRDAHVHRSAGAAPAAGRHPRQRPAGLRRHPRAGPRGAHGRAAAGRAGGREPDGGEHARRGERLHADAPRGPSPRRLPSRAPRLRGRETAAGGAQCACSWPGARWSVRWNARNAWMARTASGSAVVMRTSPPRGSSRKV
jgi:hypothetical protein